MSALYALEYLHVTADLSKAVATPTSLQISNSTEGLFPGNLTHIAISVDAHRNRTSTSVAVATGLPNLGAHVT